MEDKYLLYLEQFVYYSFTGKDLLVFNEVNNTIIEYTNIIDEVFLDILSRIESLKNTYTIELNKKEIDDNIVTDFIKKLRENFSGDCILKETNTNILSIKPVLVFSDLEFTKIDEFYGVGNKLKLLLQEITINLGHYGCEDGLYPPIFKISNEPNNPIIYDFFDKILKDLDAYINVQNINIICYPGIKLNELNNFIKKLNNKIIINIHVDIQDAQYICESLGNRPKFFIYTTSEKNNIDKIYSLLLKYNVIPCFIIKDYSDIEKINEDELGSIDFNLSPILIDSKFLEEFVYISREDILSQELKIKQILVNKEVNRNFFGRIYIDEEGFIAAHKESKSSLNIQSNSIDDFILYEMKYKDTWFLTRDKVEPCNKCMYCHLCPSISNYELTLCKHNLCSIFGV